MTIQGINNNSEIEQSNNHSSSMMNKIGKVALTISKFALPILLGVAVASFVAGPIGLGVGALAALTAGIIMFTISRSNIPPSIQEEHSEELEVKEEAQGPSSVIGKQLLTRSQRKDRKAWENAGFVRPLTKVQSEPSEKKPQDSSSNPLGSIDGATMVQDYSIDR